MEGRVVGEGSKVWENQRSKGNGRKVGGEGGRKGGEGGVWEDEGCNENGRRGGEVCPLLGVLNMVKVNTHCFSGLFKPGRQENKVYISITRFTKR